MAIDMESEDWRTHNFKRNDDWRSTKVYTCVVCETKTNYWMMGGWPGMGPRLLCPYSGINHDKPENVLHEKIRAFQSRLYADALTKRERAEIDQEIRELRNEFKTLNPRDDVVKGK